MASEPPADQGAPRADDGTALVREAGAGAGADARWSVANPRRTRL